MLIVILIVILRPGKVRQASKPVAGNRVHPGDPCPCGHGTVRVTRGRFGEFLECTDFRYDRSGCNRAWTLEGEPFG